MDLNYLDITTKPVDVSWVNSRVWFAVPYSVTGTAATKATVNFVYDPSINAAGTYTMFQSSDSYGLLGGINWENSSGKAFGLMCHANIGRVVSVDNYEEQQDNLNGTASNFTTYYRTKWFDAGSYIQKKCFADLILFLKNLVRPPLLLLMFTTTLMRLTAISVELLT